MENFYIILQQIYSGNRVSNFMRIARSLSEIFPKTFWSLFFWTHCIFVRKGIWRLVRMSHLQKRSHYSCRMFRSSKGPVHDVKGHLLCGVCVFCSIVPGIFGNQQNQHLDSIKQMLHSCLIDQSNAQVSPCVCLTC